MDEYLKNCFALLLSHYNHSLQRGTNLRAPL
jgi:hypothetical protein